MNKILVTGGSGFLGRHLIARLLNEYEDWEIRAISRNETWNAIMRAACHSERLNPIIGDIREVDTLKYALKGVDVVIHLAAMKHIDLCELAPLEAVTINVIGTMNLLKLFTGDTFIGMSTDKAIEPVNTYGATKLIMEGLVIEQARKNADRKYMIVRSGNIFGSDGSVIQRWRQQIKQSNKITVTDLEMTRFFVNVDSLVEFVIKVIEEGENGKIYIPLAKVASVGDLAKAVIEVYGNRETKMEVIGVREGEKMYERLCLPSEKNIALESTYDYSSNDVERLSVEEIKGWLIGDEGFR